MAYVDYAYYQSLYGDSAIPEADFNRLSWDACRKMDAATTGIDGVRKLAVAFPTDEYAAECVKRCACALVDVLNQMKTARENAAKTSGYTETTNGLQGKVISSISSGNESISFSSGTSGSSATVIDKALADKAAEAQLYTDTIREYLSGVADANGVNLLFMGRYPYCVRKEY